MSPPTMFEFLRGLRVFPLLPNSKKPAIGDWPRRASANIQIVESWFTGKFKDHNIGVVTGGSFFVLDCDTKNGREGVKSLARLDAAGLPRGFRVRTPSGGVHVYLTMAIPLKSGVDCVPGFPGIDIRAEGGYVVGPGSVIDGKMYEPFIPV